MKILKQLGTALAIGTLATVGASLLLAGPLGALVGTGMFYAVLSVLSADDAD